MLAERILQNAFPLNYVRLLIYLKLPSCINIFEIDNRNVPLIEWTMKVVEGIKACIGQIQEKIITFFENSIKEMEGEKTSVVDLN